MKLFLSSICFLLSFLACNSSNSASKRAIDLKLNLDKGASFKMNTDMEMNTEVMGLKMLMNMNMLGLMNVKEVNNNETEVNSTISKVKVNMTAPMGGVTSYDSESPNKESNPMTASFDKMVGKAFSMVIDKKGRVLRTMGLDSLMSMGENGTSLDGIFKQSMAILPDHPVKIGDSWSSDQVIDMQGLKMDVKNTWTLKDISNIEAICDIISNYSISPTKINKNGQAVDMSGSGNQTGIIHIDLKTGFTTKSTLNTDIEMKMNSQGVDMPIKMNMKLNMTKI
jgi:hypothetical protein